MKRCTISTGSRATQCRFSTGSWRRMPGSNLGESTSKLKDEANDIDTSELPLKIKTLADAPYTPPKFRLLNSKPKVTKDIKDLLHTLNPPNPIPRTPYLIPDDLPRSPLMDLAFHEAREKHKVPKADATKGKPGSLQARLAKNPYALMLAQPTRECKIVYTTRSGLLLPKFFLQGFNLMKHPHTRQTWYVPMDVVRHKASLKPPQLDAGGEEKKTMPSQEITESSRIQDSSEDEVLGSSTPKPKPKHIGWTNYILSSKLMFDSLFIGTSKEIRALRSKHLVPQRILRIPETYKQVINAGFREDMSTFLLEIWRRRVFEQLTYVKSLRASYLFGYKSWEEALKVPQAGCFIWTGGKNNLPGPPTEFSTVDVKCGQLGEDGKPQRISAKGPWKTRKVPVHDLRVLLGETKLTNLRKISSLWNKEIVVVKDKRNTIELRMKLWKLEGYLAQYGWGDPTPLDLDRAEQAIMARELKELEDLMEDMPECEDDLDEDVGDDADDADQEVMEPQELIERLKELGGAKAVPKDI